MGEGFLSSVMSGLSNVGNSIGNFATDLFKDGSWLDGAFNNIGDSLTGDNGILTGKNLSDTLGGAAKGFDAYSSYKAGKAKDAFDNKVFGLQEEQYKKSLEDQEKLNQTFADVWGA